MASISDNRALELFVERVWDEGGRLFRDLPWRRSRDPYEVLVSEVMLQQTQVARVVGFHERWLAQFPDLEALAAAPLSVVLANWQGLGYNRRAIALKRLAEEVVERARRDGAAAALPSDEAGLKALPGVGPATAAGVRAFAFDLPGIYLETNVRTVVLHELFSDAVGVPDREITPLLERALEIAAARGIGPRDWYFAMLDYGAHLKRTNPNPSRRSAHHSRQSRFEGSRRQKRAALLRAVMEEPGLEASAYAARVREHAAIDDGDAESVLEELSLEGFLVREGESWLVAE